MKLKSYTAPIALIIIALTVGVCLLLGPSPKNIQPDAEVSGLDPSILQYFSAKAEQYASENAENSRSESSKKSDQI